ncbi:MAG: DUF2188 domain-containing protein [Nitriliruptorales bacterium]|nr:DUF2188 domain-containing protein [Nitriliruptorales bacterium]
MLDPSDGRAMAERKSYHVTSREDGWEVKAEGASRASAVTERKSEAVDRAKRLAKNQEPSQVVVHKRDGTVQDNYSYG